MRRRVLNALWVGFGLLDVSNGQAAPPELPDGTAAATKQIATFKIPEGMKVELFAAEPKLASPVAIGLDERNRVFVAEEYRFNLGTEENRSRPFLLEDDLQLQTLDDRMKMYEKFASKFDSGMDWFGKVADQVRLVEDADGDGQADRSTVFAPDFNGTLDGLAAGVMANDGDVYFTCIPNLWRLRDTNHDGVADERTILHTGFGVNAGFLGHDLHGLCWGPDGKLYFSVGDRGFHLTTNEGQVLHGPRTGAIFRCYPDGSQLEVVMRGLRNPQEIAFDQFGNLFAADNNCDKGDHARLVYVLEGADAGWNMAYQSMPEPYLTGPWHAEKMWHLSSVPATDPQRPAWALPPVGKLGAGPAGFTYYPGTGLSPRYDNHFFMCNYTGNGGIESFSVQSHGAGFAIVDEHDFLKPISATDCEFGYNGKLYISDFVNLIWNGGSSGGRIYTLFDTKRVNDPSVKSTAELFRNGFKLLSTEKLTELLSHLDLRVRQRSQFVLAERGYESVRFLQATLATSNNRFARLHALWGLGQIAARSPQKSVQPSARQESLKAIAGSLEDSDIEVRAHAAKLLGDLGHLPAADSLTKRLTDENPRVRLFAAMSLGKLQHLPALVPLFEMLQQSDDSDPWLRHAGVMALARIGNPDSLIAHAQVARPAVRLAVLLALRWQLTEPQRSWPIESMPEARELVRQLPVSSQPTTVSHPPYSPMREFRPNLDHVKSIAQFLRDEQWSLVTEAARAINDTPLEAAMQALAALALRPDPTPSGMVPEALLRRVINANFRIGGVEEAQRLVSFIVEPGWSLTIRREALAALYDWDQPSPRDRVMGHWRPVSDREASSMAAFRWLLADRVAMLLAGTPVELQADLVQLIAKYQLPTDDAIFAEWVTDSTKNRLTRNAALRLLATRNAKQLDVAINAALKSDLASLRAEARDVLALVRPVDAIPILSEALTNASASMLERQRAVTTLASLKVDASDTVLKFWTERLVSNQVPDPLQLDVLEAATARDLPELKRTVEQFRAQLAASGPLAQYNVSLHGGNAELGREIFIGHRVGQCIRCHSVGDSLPGGKSGPNLHEVALRHDRASLLQSLVDPNAKIAKGFETVTLVLESGQIVGGLIRREDANEIVLEQPDGKWVTLKPADVEERTLPKSTMPEMNRALTPRELRDLVEFLAMMK